MSPLYREVWRGFCSAWCRAFGHSWGLIAVPYGSQGFFRGVDRCRFCGLVDWDGSKNPENKS